MAEKYQTREERRKQLAAKKQKKARKALQEFSKRFFLLSLSLVLLDYCQV
ncbi:hypothetical protein MGA3_08570 [Bacillus methanolicus MGA3]|nr:hypothetical protein [Bacillus methanolicus]EIJ83262.1 hypothetical protein MGA3_08570 [Bacillus methanolicus MGA3]